MMLKDFRNEPLRDVVLSIWLEFCKAMVWFQALSHRAVKQLNLDKISSITFDCTAGTLPCFIKKHS